MPNHLDSSEAWKAELLRDNRSDKSPIKANLANVCIALAACPDLKGILGYDSFTHKIMRVAPTPWRQDPGAWEPIDDLRLTEFLQRSGIDVSVDTANQGAHIRAHKQAFHPVRRYLEALTWDRNPRVEHWLTQYLGANDTPYVRAVGRKFLIAAVARAFEPGCKADTMLVLEGAQGIGKSTALRILAGEDWFSDQMPNLAGREASIQLLGKWLIEISELDAMRKAEITETKAFLSRTTDRYRAPYAKTAQDYPRQCVFAGTTNSDDYLRDATGGRRFWPVHCTRVDREELQRDRDQLWAEALTLYRAGEVWHLVGQEEGWADAEQGKRYSEDPWSEAIDRFIWLRARVTAEEVLRDSTLELRPRDIDQQSRRRVGDHLRRWGWVPGKSNGQRYFTRPATIPDEKRVFISDVREPLSLEALNFGSAANVHADNDQFHPAMAG